MFLNDIVEIVRAQILPEGRNSGIVIMITFWSRLHGFLRHLGCWALAPPKARMLGFGCADLSCWPIERTGLDGEIIRIKPRLKQKEGCDGGTMFRTSQVAPVACNLAAIINGRRRSGQSLCRISKHSGRRPARRARPGRS